MKKALSLILVLVLCLSLCACGGGEQNNETQGNTESNSTNNTTMGSTTDTTSGAGNDENSQAETPNHALVQDICGEWKPDADDAPFQSLVIQEDGSCVVDGVSATWKIEGSYTTDTELSIRVYVDGNILFGMVFYSASRTALLTKALDASFSNSPMYFIDCSINKTQH